MHRKVGSGSHGSSSSGGSSGSGGGGSGGGGASSRHLTFPLHGESEHRHRVLLNFLVTALEYIQQRGVTWSDYAGTWPRVVGR